MKSHLSIVTMVLAFAHHMVLMSPKYAVLNNFRTRDLPKKKRSL